MEDTIQVQFEVSKDKLPTILAKLSGKVENIIIDDTDEVTAVPASHSAGPDSNPTPCKPAQQPE